MSLAGATAIGASSRHMPAGHPPQLRRLKPAGFFSGHASAYAAAAHVADPGGGPRRATAVARPGGPAGAVATHARQERRPAGD